MGIPFTRIPDGRLIPWSTSPALLLFEKGRQKYVIVLSQSAARKVNSPVVSDITGVLFHVAGGSTVAVIQGRYSCGDLFRTLPPPMNCRNDLSILMTSNLVEGLVAWTSSTVHSAGAWKNCSDPGIAEQSDRMSMPTESPTLPVPPFVSEASINVPKASVHVSPVEHRS